MLPWQAFAYRVSALDPAQMAYRRTLSQATLGIGLLAISKIHLDLCCSLTSQESFFYLQSIIW